MLFTLVQHFDVSLVVYEQDIAYPIPDDVRLVCIGTDLSTAHSMAYKFGRLSVRVRRLARCFATGHFDVILSFIDMSNVNVAMAHALSRTSAKLVLVERTICAEFFRTNPGASRIAPVAKYLLRRAYTYADRVVVISHAMRDYVAELGVHREIDVIHNGIDTDVYFPPSAGGQMPPTLVPDFRAAPTRLLHVGGFNYRKNQSFLLDVLKLLPERYAAAHLFFIGSGDYAPVAARAQQLGVSARCHFLGWRNDVADYMRHADALFLCSLSEGTPNVVYESLACGLPVVSTDCTPALPEMIIPPAQATLVPLGDAAAFASAAAAVLDVQSPDYEGRRAFGAAYGAHFARRRCEERYVSLLFEVLSARRTTGLAAPDQLPPRSRLPDE